ncbi:MAG: heavy-metal-associated domain-containing protein [Microbacterium ginsengisoli]|nr:heavy-metal-associated domain-containing protein [Microbacterium ginsengisoli]
MNNRTYPDLGLTDAKGGCACCAPAHEHAAATSAEAIAGDLRTDFLVEGMTCEHCVRSVTEEVSAIDGVRGVTVDLHAGGVSRVTISSDEPVDPAKVRDAVEEAGYSLSTTA